MPFVIVCNADEDEGFPREIPPRSNKSGFAYILAHQLVMVLLTSSKHFMMNLKARA